MPKQRRPLTDEERTALALSFPLRDNYVAQVVIPRDLTKREADRLSDFIRSLATDRETK